MSARRLGHDWHDAPLPENVEVGPRTWIYSSYAFIHHRSRRAHAVRIGADSGVYVGSFFETGPDAEVVVGDFCTLAGPILATRDRIEIGSYAFISYGTVLTDSEFPVPPGAPDATPSAGEIVIGENAWIGVRAVVLGGARIGEGAIVAAAAVVDFEVPPFAIVAGNPARIVGEAPPRR